MAAKAMAKQQARRKKEAAANAASAEARATSALQQARAGTRTSPLAVVPGLFLGAMAIPGWIRSLDAALDVCYCAEGILFCCLGGDVAACASKGRLLQASAKAVAGASRWRLALLCELRGCADFVVWKLCHVARVFRLSSVQEGRI